MQTIKPHFWHFIVMLLLLSSSEITLYLCLQFMSSSITKSQIRPLANRTSYFLCFTNIQTSVYSYQIFTSAVDSLVNPTAKYITGLPVIYHFIKFFMKSSQFGEAPCLSLAERISSRISSFCIIYSAIS